MRYRARAPPRGVGGAPARLEADGDGHEALGDPAELEPLERARAASLSNRRSRTGARCPARRWQTARRRACSAPCRCGAPRPRGGAPPRRRAPTAPPTRRPPTSRCAPRAAPSSTTRPRRPPPPLSGTSPSAAARLPPPCSKRPTATCDSAKPASAARAHPELPAVRDRLLRERGVEAEAEAVPEVVDAPRRSAPNCAELRNAGAHVLVHRVARLRRRLRPLVPRETQRVLS